MMFRVTESELKVIRSRSGGPGGQNVNKRETQVAVKWSYRKSRLLNEKQKRILTQVLSSRINKDSEIVITRSDTRSQERNYELAVELLNELVNNALKPRKIRKRTRPPKRAIEKRLKEKRMRGEKKRLRQKPGEYE